MIIDPTNLTWEPTSDPWVSRASCGRPKRSEDIWCSGGELWQADGYVYMTVVSRYGETGYDTERILLRAHSGLQAGDPIPAYLAGALAEMRREIMDEADEYRYENYEDGG